MPFADPDSSEESRAFTRSQARAEPASPPGRAVVLGPGANDLSVEVAGRGEDEPVPPAAAVEEPGAEEVDPPPPGAPETEADRQPPGSSSTSTIVDAPSGGGSVRAAPTTGSHHTSIDDGASSSGGGLGGDGGRGGSNRSSRRPTPRRSRSRSPRRSDHASQRSDRRHDAQSSYNRGRRGDSRDSRGGGSYDDRHDGRRVYHRGSRSNSRGGNRGGSGYNDRRYNRRNDRHDVRRGSYRDNSHDGRRRSSSRDRSNERGDRYDDRRGSYRDNDRGDRRRSRSRERDQQRQPRTPEPGEHVDQGYTRHRDERDRDRDVGRTAGGAWSMTPHTPPAAPAQAARPTPNPRQRLEPQKHLPIDREAWDDVLVGQPESLTQQEVTALRKTFNVASIPLLRDGCLAPDDPTAAIIGSLHALQQADRYVDQMYMCSMVLEAQDSDFGYKTLSSSKVRKMASDRGNEVFMEAMTCITLPSGFGRATNALAKAYNTLYSGERAGQNFLRSYIASRRFEFFIPPPLFEGTDLNYINFVMVELLPRRPVLEALQHYQRQVLDFDAVPREAYSAFFKQTARLQTAIRTILTPGTFPTDEEYNLSALMAAVCSDDVFAMAVFRVDDDFKRKWTRAVGPYPLTPQDFTTHAAAYHKADGPLRLPKRVAVSSLVARQLPTADPGACEFCNQGHTKEECPFGRKVCYSCFKPHGANHTLQTCYPAKHRFDAAVADKEAMRGAWEFLNPGYKGKGKGPRAAYVNAFDADEPSYCSDCESGVECAVCGVESCSFGCTYFVHVWFSPFSDTQPLTALVDTGSQLSFMSPTVAEHLEPRKGEGVVGTLANGTRTELVSLLATATLTLKTFGQGRHLTLTHTFYVLPGLSCAFLLGGDFLEAYSASVHFNHHTLALTHNATTYTFSLFPLQNHELAVAAVQAQVRVAGDHHIPFGDLATEECMGFVMGYAETKLFAGQRSICSVKATSFEVRLDKLPGQQWPHVRGRPIPVHLVDEYMRIVEEMIEAGVLHRVTQVKAVCPSMLVAKPSSTQANPKWRLVTDFSSLTDVLERSHYALPIIRELLNTISNVVSQMEDPVFCVVDLKSAFFALPIVEEHQNILGTYLPDGSAVAYRSLPMGLALSPELFQAYADTITLPDLRGKYQHNYLDDQLLCADGREAMTELLRRKFANDLKHGVQYSDEKCLFFTSEIEWLAHSISREGVRPAASKVSAVRDMPEPTTKSDLHSVYGLMQFFARYIPNYSALAYPLRKLLRANVPFVWTEEQREAFARLKHELSVTLVRHISFDASFIVETDASVHGLGVVLLQPQHDPSTGLDAEFPVAYASRATTDAETRYPACELEALAVVFACRTFSHLLLGARFLIRSDNTSVVHLLRKRKHPRALAARLERWRMALYLFSFDIVHRRGTLNGAADALSRLPAVTDKAVVLAEAAKDYEFLNQALGGATDTEPADSVAPGVLICTVDAGPAAPAGSAPPAELDLFTSEDLVAVATAIHEETLHSGIHRTLFLARHKYDREDIKASLVSAVISDCVACLRFSTAPTLRAELGAIEASFPNELVCMDIFSKKMGGNMVKYVTLVDAFSGYTYIEMFKRATAVSVIRAVRRFFAYFGVPLAILTDNGSQFRSGTFAEFIADYNVDLRFSRPNVPMSNGVVERMHRVLGEKLGKILFEYDQDNEAPTEDEFADFLHETLASFLIAYNTAGRSAYGLSAYEIFFGRNPITHQPALRADANTTKEDVARQKAAAQLERRAESARKAAAPLVVGVRVMYLNYNRRKALDPRFIGPFEVCELGTRPQYVVIRGLDKMVKTVRVSALLPLSSEGSLETHVPGSRVWVEEATPQAMPDDDVSDMVHRQVGADFDLVV